MRAPPTPTGTPRAESNAPSALCLPVVAPSRDATAAPNLTVSSLFRSSIGQWDRDAVPTREGSVATSVERLKHEHPDDEGGEPNPTDPLPGRATGDQLSSLTTRA